MKAMLLMFFSWTSERHLMLCPRKDYLLRWTALESGKVLDWVREWLTDKTQKVVLNGKESELGEVRSGVVQGSSLGPTLFLIYINGISCTVNDGESALELTSSILSLFADDTKWGRCVDTVEDTERFQGEINRLELWSRTWQMQFNTSKCKVMHLGRRGNPGHVYMMGDTPLENTHDIGVMVDESLKPSLHCAKAAAKANAVLGQISRATHLSGSI